MARLNLRLANGPICPSRSRASGILLIVCALAMPGCTVLAVVDLTAAAVVGTAGLVADAAVGTVKIGSKVIGKTADLVFGDDPASAP